MCCIYDESYYALSFFLTFWRHAHPMEHCTALHHHALSLRTMLFPIILCIATRCIAKCRIFEWEPCPLSTHGSVCGSQLIRSPSQTLDCMNDAIPSLDAWICFWISHFWPDLFHTLHISVLNPRHHCKGYSTHFCSPCLESDHVWNQGTEAKSSLHRTMWRLLYHIQSHCFQSNRVMSSNWTHGLSTHACSHTLWCAN